MADTTPSTTTDGRKTDAKKGSGRASYEAAKLAGKIPNGPDGQPLTKTAFKKMNNNIKRASVAQARKLVEKANKLEKKKKQERHNELKAAKANLSPEEVEKVKQARKDWDKKLALSFTESTKLSPGILFDLAYDELMTDRERSSMQVQISQSYGVFKKSARPLALSICGDESQYSLEGIKETGVLQLVRKHYELDLWGRWGFKDCGETSFEQVITKDDLVYLSADSENEIQTLDRTKTYVVGGLVDRNRHKYVSQKRAEALGIQTARLPLGAFMESLQASTVLTVNHVFQILTDVVVCGDWTRAMESVIPKRKALDLTAGSAANQGTAAEANITQNQSKRPSESLLAASDDNNDKDSEAKKSRTDETGETNRVGEGSEEEQDGNRVDKYKINRSVKKAITKMQMRKAKRVAQLPARQAREAHDIKEREEAKVAVVTGASSGIGLAISEELARRGWNVIMVARDSVKLDEAANKLRFALCPDTSVCRRDVQVLAIPGDAGDAVAMWRLKRFVYLRFGHVNLMAMCAGTFKWDADLFDQAQPLLMQANLDTKSTAFEYLAPLFEGKLNPKATLSTSSSSSPSNFPTDDNTTSPNQKPMILVVGSKAGHPDFEERLKQIKDQSGSGKQSQYIKSMQAVRQWALALEEERSDLRVRLVEPPLVDTPLARKEFSDVVSDWSRIQTVDVVVEEALRDL